jgi:arylsulfatase A-like enzyme
MIRAGGALFSVAAMGLIAGLVLLMWLSASGRAERARPSLLLIVADTLRADRLPIYGYSESTSPELSRLAERSVVYEEALSTAPFTMPSMSALLSGRYPDVTGVNNHSSSNRLHLYGGPTIAELAREAGYRTGAVVTNGWLANPKMGFGRGFADYVDKRLENARTTTDEALDLMSSYGDEEFFLWVHYIDPHMPYRPPQRFARAFGNPSGTSAVVDDFVRRRRPKTDIYFFPGYPEEELEKTRQLYDASIAFMDSQIGRLLRELEASGRSDDTIVVFLSDHGESLGDHGLHFAHDFNVYQELVRVPLLVSIPSVRPARVDRAVSLIDLVPSMCSWLELECTGPLDGEPLPLLDDGAAQPRTLFAAGAPHRDDFRSPRIYRPGIDGRWVMIKQGQRKLIKIPHPGGALWELYDLGQDPGETVNLAESRGFDDLRRELISWETLMRNSRPGVKPASEGDMDHKAIEGLRAMGYVE